MPEMIPLGWFHTILGLLVLFLIGISFQLRWINR